MVRIITLLCTILSLWICTGCGSPQDEEIVFEYTIQSVEYSDGSYSFRKDLSCMQTPNARYYFESPITDEQRRACVEATEQILQELGPSDEITEICILDQTLYDSVYISGHTLFVSPQDWRSVGYITKVLLAVSGQGSHYGLAYGYANVLGERFQWTGSEDGQFTAPEVSEICDLNYLCFDNAFASETNILAARQTACDFAEYYIAEHGDESLWKLLCNSDTTAGMAAVAEALGKYYADNGISTEISTVRYGYGGVSNDYVVYSDYGIFYISDGWVDESWEYNPLVSENFLPDNYPEVRQFFEINLQQFEQYQALFALDSYDNDLKIIFTNSTTYSNPSVYILAQHAIFLKSVADLTHEYIHALTIPAAAENLETWSQEGFATYFAVWYDYYSREFLNDDYNSANFLQEYRSVLGRPLDVATDNDEILHFAAYYMGYEDPNESYLSGASFVGYLVEQYGIACVTEHLFGDGNTLPKSYEALLEDWLGYLNELYQDFAKNIE